MSAIFEADGVGKSWRGRRVLTTASMRVQAGRITVLFGRNGCGKSTLLRAAVGLTTPDWGVFRMHGRWIRRPRLHALARAGLFFVPERDLLTRNRTVNDHFATVRRAFPGTDEHAIDRMQIGGLLDRYTHELSGGERRRVEFALALARRPVCLLADEPFMGIAPGDADVIARQLRRLAADGCGILVTGHEVSALLDIADEVLWMVAGTTHLLGPPSHAAVHDQFRREYLDPARA
ncbi:MAG: ATP-binding cassette domain-containing protein [Gemmatimonadetes bacterium]|nr:ATP-binding cassette domain-containing protein [Gemmatimonadota bacterium]